MDRIVKAITASVVALAVPTGASAACWDARSTVAAEIRALDVMLMVSALRCRLDGPDFVQDYNHFVRTNRVTLTGAVDDLRDHFDEGDGWRPSLERFDRYVTAIANEHGERGRYSCQDLRLITEDAIEAGGDQQELLGLARAVGITPRFVGGICRSDGDPRGRWAAAAPPASRPAPLPPVISSVGMDQPAPVAPEPVAVAETPNLPANLPVTRVAEAPIAEPLPVDAAVSEPAVAIARTSPTAAPALQPAVANVIEAPATRAPSRAATFDIASGSVTVPEGGEIEVTVSEGPEQNGTRSRTYRIRRPID